MSHLRAGLLFFLLLGFFLRATADDGKSEAQPPIARFRMQELDTELKVGYAVILVDVDHDGKKDIVVVDTTRVVWYQNPTWKKRIIIDGQTKPDNVCIAAHDIDGDGKVDFALGAEWKPFNTQSGGTLQWLRRRGSLDGPWEVFPIDTEPTIHRIRFADIDGDGKLELVSVPLMGRGSSAKQNWQDGEPVRTVAYRIPNHPAKERWPVKVLDQSLRVIHNFEPIPARLGKGHDLLMASYEGVHLLTRDATGQHSKVMLGTGNQENPKEKRGASEIKQGTLKSGRKVIATVEPWHGNQAVVYSEPSALGQLWGRHVVDEQLRWGHAVAFADFDGDGGQEVIFGVRDDPKAGEKGVLRRGVRLYRAQDELGTKWERQIIELGGVAVEDLTVGDLNDDGRPDIVAVGRQTRNVRIYWNEGPPKKN